MDLMFDVSAPPFTADHLPPLIFPFSKLNAYCLTCWQQSFMLPATYYEIHTVDFIQPPSIRAPLKKHCSQLKDLYRTESIIALGSQ